MLPFFTFLTEHGGSWNAPPEQLRTILIEFHRDRLGCLVHPGRDREGIEVIPTRDTPVCESTLRVIRAALRDFYLVMKDEGLYPFPNPLSSETLLALKREQTQALANRGAPDHAGIRDETRAQSRRRPTAFLRHSSAKGWEPDLRKELILTNYLFTHFKLQIKPLHPDGTGGLAILGRLLWLCVSIMLWVALLIGIGVISQNLARLSTSEIVLLGAVYLTLTPALLLGWLIFPHRMMVKAREEMLQPLTEEYQRTLMQSLRTSASDPRSVVAETRRLVALKQRYDLVRDSFPTWPLETSAVSRIGVTVLLPLLFPLITELFPLAFHALGF